MKKILVAVFSIMMLLGFATTTQSLAKQGEQIEIKVDGKTISLEKANVEVNGKKVETDVPSVFYEGNTLVPARIVSEELGAEVKWDNKNRAAIIKTAGKEIIVKENSSKASINGKEKTMPEGAKMKLMAIKGLKNARTMVPFRFIAEELGATVEWNKETRTAVITSKKDVIEKPIEPVKPQEPQVKLNKIKSITTKSIDGSNIPQIHIEADSQISYKDVSAKNANQIVIEIKDSVLEKDFKVNVNNDVVIDIEAKKLSDKNVKVTVNLKKQMRYQVLNDKVE